MESLEIILSLGSKTYSQEEKEQMAAEKTGFIGAIWSVWGQRHWPLGQSMCSALCGRTAGKQALAPPAKTPPHFGTNRTGRIL